MTNDRMNESVPVEKSRSSACPVPLSEGANTLDARIEQLKRELEERQRELVTRRTGLRYQIGDAFVRAAHPSWDTVKLPFRLVNLLWQGYRRARLRRREARRRRDPMPAASDVTDVTVAPFSIPAELYGSAPPELCRWNDLRIALVADEFSWRCWQFEADVFALTPQNWEDVLSDRKPDLVLVESVWSGVGDSWYFQLNELGRHRRISGEYALPGIARWCRRHDVPLVFYNKEDPPNFEVFVDAARECDFVFTSDANCIPAYSSRLGHERVFALPFAAQPRIHNPVLAEPRSRAVCFAGAWYAERHGQRHHDAQSILLPALDFGLDIYDRMAGSTDPAYRWPEVFRPFVRGGLTYAQMLTAYRLYEVFLNINSVSDSPTMFARRVFELLACGTPVISSPARGIVELLGEDTVLLSSDAETTRRHLERLLRDGDLRARLALRGMRKVLGEHTYSHRLQTVLDAVGLRRPRLAEPTIAMLAVVSDREQAESAWGAFQRQAYASKRLILCTDCDAAAVDVGRRFEHEQSIGVIVSAAATCGALFARAIEASESAYIAALNPSDFYGRHYLTDYANATQFVVGPVFGKASVHEVRAATELALVGQDQCYRQVDAVEPFTLCAARSWAGRRAAGLVGIRDARQWWRQLMAGAGKVYSSDSFNYVRVADEHGFSIAADAGRFSRSLREHVET